MVAVQERNGMFISLHGMHSASSPNQIRTTQSAHHRIVATNNWLGTPCGVSYNIDLHRIGESEVPQRTIRQNEAPYILRNITYLRGLNNL